MKRLLILGGVLASGLALGGCGFTPLYAAPGVVPKLAAIDVTAPQGRTGFLLREHLDDAIRDTGFARENALFTASSMELARSSGTRAPTALAMRSAASPKTTTARPFSSSARTSGS